MNCYSTISMVTPIFNTFEGKNAHRGSGMCAGIPV